MRTALYARFSTDLQNPLSAQDQLNKLRAVAQARGWSIACEYKDEGISGSDNTRPGYQKLLADAEAHKFDVVLVECLDRLSRRLADVIQTYDALKFRDIKLHTLDLGELNDLTVGMMGTIAQWYLSDLGRKTRRGLAAKAGRGLHTGGRAFGYRSVRNGDGSKLTIDEAEAKVARHIFAAYADGQSPRAIAAGLNEKGIKSARGGTWAMSAIYAMLRNPLYHGEVVWGRKEFRKHPLTRKRRAIRTSEDKWITHRDSSLAILDDDLWARVQARLAEQHHNSAAIRQALHDKARTGRGGSTYLLSGMLRCGECGAPYTITQSNMYGCSAHANRGKAVCGNDRRINRKQLERAVLDLLKDGLFTEAGIDLFKTEVRKVLKARIKTRDADHAQAEKELKSVERDLGRLVDAIKAGVAIPSIKTEAEALEVKRIELLHTLKDRDGGLERIEHILPAATDRFARLIDRLRIVNGAEMSKAKTDLKALLGDLIIRPSHDGRETEVVARGHYLGLIGLADPSPRKMHPKPSLGSVVAGAGFEPATFRL